MDMNKEDVVKILTDQLLRMDVLLAEEKNIPVKVVLYLGGVKRELEMILAYESKLAAPKKEVTPTIPQVLKKSTKSTEQAKKTPLDLGKPPELSLQEKREKAIVEAIRFAGKEGTTIARLVIDVDLNSGTINNILGAILSSKGCTIERIQNPLNRKEYIYRELMYGATLTPANGSEH